MVTSPPLTAEEKERHTKLIDAYFQEVKHTSEYESTFLKNGAQKGIYRVRCGEEEFLAAAAARDVSRILLQEYNLLHQLYNGASAYFPRPIAHYSPQNRQELGDLFLMELLPHKDLDEFRLDKKKMDSRKDLAYAIGKSVAVVNGKTNRFSSEPHNGNILARYDKNNRIEIKFCDAIQFLVGNIEQAARAVVASKDDRPECFRFIGHFRQGLADGMSTSQQISIEEALRQLEFLRQYNDIF